MKEGRVLIDIGNFFSKSLWGKQLMPLSLSILETVMSRALFFLYVFLISTFYDAARKYFKVN